MSTKHKSYRELCHISSYAEKLNYLKLKGRVGEETFGRSRPSNQIFYQSQRWKDVRDKVLVRDRGCDLGIPGRDISKYAIVHHINPITEDDILNDADCLYDMDNLVTVSKMTHDAIHYGDSALVAAERLPQERSPNDMCPWK